MVGSFIFLALCLAMAAAATAPLWLGRRPAEGWVRWFTQSWDAVRARGRDRGELLAVDSSLDELLRDPGNSAVPAYTTPGELRDLFADTRARL